MNLQRREPVGPRGSIHRLVPEASEGAKKHNLDQRPADSFSVGEPNTASFAIIQAKEPNLAASPRESCRLRLLEAAIEPPPPFLAG